MNDGVLATLDAHECAKLLRAASVGRVGFLLDRRVLIIPVNYLMDGSVIYFRTEKNSVLGVLADGMEVSFQVDSFDVESKRGWSVLGHGWAVASEAHRLDDPLPWAPGPRSLVIGIKITHLGGRVVTGSSEVDSVLATPMNGAPV